MTPDSTTLPIAPHDLLWGLVFLTGATMILWGLLKALRQKLRPKFPKAWLAVVELGKLPVVLLGLLWVGLFGLTIVAAYLGVWEAIHPKDAASQPNLGLGALLAALLGAPFVIWGTWLKYQTVRFQKEGHMTDRINKAVEQLGAEKTVKRREFTPRLKTTKDGKAVLDDGKPSPEFRTDGTPLGTWESIEETVPNIEVRIGAILSLERIAQDSTIHDKGRDHVRVMEILCAYVRENSNARKPVDFPEPKWEPLKDSATAEQRATHEARRRDRFGTGQWDSKARNWAQSLPKPRSDVAQALKVIGRRTDQQRRIEAAWPEVPTEDTVWPFDIPCPSLPNEPGEAALSAAELQTFRTKLNIWKERIQFHKGYRLDLSGSNLQGAKLSPMRPDASDAVFAGAILTRARMEGADLSSARMEGADVSLVRLEGATLREAKFDAANLANAYLEGCVLPRVSMVGANLWETSLEAADLSQAMISCANLGSSRLEAATLSLARIEGADLQRARMEEANFTKARIEWADLRGACLEGTNLTDARMQGAALRGVRIDAETRSIPALLR
jgi:uncharacterized protein YjbI with pentapeptide repeats